MFALKLLICCVAIIEVSCQCECPIKRKSQCSKNEVFLNDNSYRCQSTCAMYGVSVNCKEDYAPKGNCYCKAGYARYYQCGPCITLNHPVCQELGEGVVPSKKLCSERPNEQFSSSGGRNCRDTCDGYDTKPCFATIMPVPGPYLPVCECIDGFARLPSGECVHAKDPRCYELYRPTPERCAKLGKLYSPFGSACQQGCKDYNPDANICYQTEKSKDATLTSKKVLILDEACYCAKGTVVDYQGRCIPFKDCPVV